MGYRTSTKSFCLQKPGCNDLIKVALIMKWISEKENVLEGALLKLLPL